MTLRNNYRNTLAVLSLSPAARVTGTSTGTAVDLRGFDAAMIVVAFGAYTDGTHMPSLQHSVDNVTFTNASASDVDGALTAVNSAGGANTVQSIGYIGANRYVRVVMTTTGATTGALSSALVVMGKPRTMPVV